MSNAACPFSTVSLVTADVGLPPVVLDVEVSLPVGVARRAHPPTAFYRNAVALLGTLRHSMVSPAELESRLRQLALVATAHAQYFPVSVPDIIDSDAVSLGSVGLREVEVAERIRYDHFFGVRRVTGLDEHTLAGVIFQVFGSTLDDMASTQLGIHELIALLASMVEATRWIEYVGELRRPLRPDRPIKPLRRFVLGHQVFAVLAAFARHHIRGAIAAPADECTASELTIAAVHLRATTAAMWQTVSFPPFAYRELVRPMMDDASSEQHGFSGGDNFDFRRLRESWEVLHGVLIASWDELPVATRDAARVLFETVVLDNEHHIALAAEMVGLSPSLNAARHARQLQINALAATAALRLNTEDRRALFDSLPPETDRPA